MNLVAGVICKTDSARHSFLLYSFKMTLRRTKRTNRRFSAGLPWTEAEQSRLKELYPKTINRDLAAMFGRSEWGIIGKARGLGLEKDYSNGYRRQQCEEPAAWSAMEEDLLRRLFPITPNEEIAETIGRTLNAVANKARKMGLRKSEFWSEAEDELLKKFYKTLSYGQLAKRLGRTKGSVQIRVITLGLECKVEDWSTAEDDFLRKNYRTMNFQVIAKKLGRTYGAVAVRARRIGLMKKHSWPKADIQKLKGLYARFSARQVAEMMGRSYNAVRGQIKLLRLHKDQCGVEKDKSLVLETPADNRSPEPEYHVISDNESVEETAGRPEMIPV